MTYKERFADQEEMLRTAMETHTAKLYTALPGIVQSYDAVKLTVSVLPAIQGTIVNPDNSVSYINLPLLTDVPVCFPRGGGVVMTFPIAKGDSVLLVFSARNIDNWWQSGGPQPPMTKRKHSLSDAIAIPGPFSQDQVISDVSTTNVELRSTDGSTKVSMDPAGQVVTVKAPGGITLDGPVTVTKTLTVQDKITGNNDVVSGSISLKSHTHADPQGGTVGPPQ